MWLKKNTSTALGASHAIFACFFSGKAAADRSYVLLNVSRPLKNALCWMLSFFGGRIDLNSKGIVVYKATKLSNLHMLIMNPSEKWSKYPCWRPPACEFVEPAAPDLEPWFESRRAGGVDWKPWGVTEFNYQKIEEFRQNWKVVI